MTLWLLVGLLACGDKEGEPSPLLTDGYDADGDGFPSIDDGGTDCDDNDADVYPGAPDTWYDGVDSDCGYDDDYDADGDGAQIDDVDPAGDCDDGDASIGPDALELCETGTDEDCDGSADEDGCGWQTTSASSVEHARDLEFLGWSIATDCDIDGDGKLEVLVGAPGDDYDGVTGRVLTASEGDELWPNTGEIEIVRPTRPASFGSSIDCDGDLDGDGYDDLVVTAFSEGDGNYGRTVVWLGPVSGDDLTASAAEVDIEFVGSGGSSDTFYNGHLASIMAGGGGEALLLLAAGDSYSPWNDPGDDTLFWGSLYLLPALGLVGRVKDKPAGSILLRGEESGEYSVGDLDGDGIDDVLRSLDDSYDDPEGTRPEVCGTVYSGADIAAASTLLKDTSVVLGEGDALTTLNCTGGASDHIAVANVYADQDLDLDGHNDAFLATYRGFYAFAGGVDAWSGEREPDALLYSDFCYGYGLDAAAFDRDDSDLLTTAVSLQWAPDCDTWIAGHRGRVALFQGWDWTTYGFDDAWRWIAWDADEQGVDPALLGPRPVAFSHETGSPRLWFGDPTWRQTEWWGTNDGRLVSFDLDELP